MRSSRRLAALRLHESDKRHATSSCVTILGSRERVRMHVSIWTADSGTLAAGMDKPKILTPKELRVIMPRLSGWKLAQNKLSRTFEFQDFVQSLSFVNSLVAYFETVEHHPDVRIAYGEVTFELTRYDLGGKVTDRDVEVAKKISSVYRSRS
jgi:4a-hydroxytetrahydrobiopterin dehydratase